MKRSLIVLAILLMAGVVAAQTSWQLYQSITGSSFPQDSTKYYYTIQNTSAWRIDAGVTIVNPSQGGITIRNGSSQEFFYARINNAVLQCFEGTGLTLTYSSAISGTGTLQVIYESGVITAKWNGTTVCDLSSTAAVTWGWRNATNAEGRVLNTLSEYYPTPPTATPTPTPLPSNTPLPTNPPTATPTVDPALTPTYALTTTPADTPAALVTLYPARYESNDGGIYRTGTWYATACATCPDNESITTSTNSELFFRMYGDGLTIHRLVGTAYGSAEVCFNDWCQLIDNSNAGDLGVVDSTTLLRPGYYNVSIRNTSTTGQWLALDAITVRDDSATYTVPTPTALPTATADSAVIPGTPYALGDVTITPRIINETDSGQILIIILLTVIAALMAGFVAIYLINKE